MLILYRLFFIVFFFFFSSRRRHTRLQGDWSSDVCSSDLTKQVLRLTWSPVTMIFRTALMRTASAVRSEPFRISLTCTTSHWSLPLPTLVLAFLRGHSTARFSTE